MVNFNEIIQNDYVLSKDGLKWIEFNKSINKLREKYPNIIDDFQSFDGFAFPSNDYVTQFTDLKKKVKLLQIGNVNEAEWVITETQKFEYVPDKYLQTKKKYLISYPCILISLTGGSDTANDITSFFDGSFKAFLNQRVSALTMKKYDEDYFYYFYALTKTKSFKEQWLGKGGIQKNTVSSDRAKTYLPKIGNKQTVKFVSNLTQAIIHKEQLIKERHITIFNLIETELLKNQKQDKFKFELPTINEILKTERLDTSLYSKGFKYWNFLVKNYYNGSKDLISRGFTWSRGTSLEQGFIGVRVDSEKYHKGFYELVLPTNISQYGFVEKSTYIGTPTKLKTISQGDIIFGGEGFGKGRTYVVVEDSNNVATNYHGIRIINTNKNLSESIFIRCFLAFWREKGMIDYIGVGGSGGHCAPSYFHLIETPLFEESKQKEIALLYHNAKVEYKSDTFTLDNFLTKDNDFNSQAGIYELDKTAKQLKEILNQAIDNIVNDKEVVINFNNM